MTYRSVAQSYVQTVLDASSKAGLKMGDREIHEMISASAEGNRIKMEDFLSLIEVAANIPIGEPLPLRVAKQVKISTYNLLAHLIINSIDFGEAVQHIVRYGALIADIGKTETSFTREKVRVSFQSDYEAHSVNSLLVEIAIFNWVSFLGLVVDLPPASVTVSFEHSAPTEGAEFYQSHSLPLVSFQQGYNGVEFPADFLERSISLRDNELEKILRKKAELMLHKCDSTFKYVDIVRKHLIALLPVGKVTLGDIAQDMEVAPYELRKKLKENGTDFSRVLSEFRKTLTVQYMDNEDMSLAEISYLLGFSEQSAFTRAFKKWFGVTPTSYKGNPAP